MTHDALYKSENINNMQNNQNKLLLIDFLHPDMAKKIIKDFKLPFSYINQEHFSTMVDNMLQVAPEYNDAVDMMINICLRINKDDQPALCGVIRDITDAMVEHILGNTGYHAFIQCDINKFFPVEPNNIPTGDNYNHENAGKNFISIDLKNAAFQAMKTWDRIYGKEYGYLIGESINSYKEFVSYIVDVVGLAAAYSTTTSKDVINIVIDYISTCKSLRQVIFGKTNAKRNTHIEKFIMQSVMKNISSSFHIIPVRFNNDEVVYEYNEYLEKALYAKNSLNHLNFTISSEKINDVISVPLEFHKNLYTLEEYSLIQHDDYIPIEHKKRVKFYVKDNMSMITHIKQEPVFKGIPSQMYLIARALFSFRFDLARFFENQPILVDGVFHWLAIPCCHSGGNTSDNLNTWELDLELDDVNDDIPVEKIG